MSSVHSDSSLTPVQRQTAGLSQVSNKQQDALENYRTEHCHGVDKPTMEAHISQGKAVMSELSNLKLGSEEWKSFVASNAKEGNAVALMWFFTAKAVKQGDSYTAGSLRIANSQDPQMGQKVSEFLKASGQSYGRWSTHMNENLEKGQTGFGLDLPDQGLPGPEKRTVLFAAQPDGSIFLKLEERGFPGFKSLKTAKESILHMWDWVKTRPAKIFGQHKAARKEHTPKEVVKEFKKVLDLLFPTAKKSFFASIFAPKTATEKMKEDLVKRGKTFGIHRMDSIMQYAKTQAVPDKELSLMQQIARNKAEARYETAINPYLNRAKERGFEGDFKGNEVTLAVSIKDFE